MPYCHLRLPTFPYMYGQNRPHDCPMSQSALIMPLGELLGLVDPQDAGLFGA